VVLSARGLSCTPQLSNIDLDLHKGEILGFGGLEGQGQKELVQALFGTIRLSSGQVTLGGRTVSFGSPADAIGNVCRMVLLPEDRKVDGLLLQESVRHNIALSVMGKFSRFGLRDRGREGRVAIDMIKRLQIKAHPDQPVGQLSGGNQQKVLLARLLALEPDVLLLLDPTRGIDVGTKQEIYKLVRELAAQGTAIIFLATDYEELIGLCDRVLVFYGGRIKRELTEGEINEASILTATMNIEPTAVTQ
jgi:ribose transport system ATP-binding protein